MSRPRKAPAGKGTAIVAEVVDAGEAGAPLALLGPELHSARAFAAAALSPRTREAYAYQWQTFVTWCRERGAHPLPAESATLAAYVASRADAGWKVASIGLAMTAIRQAHAYAGHEPPNASSDVARVWKGVRRTLGTAQRRAAPVVVDELRAIVDAMPAKGLGAVRDRALLVLGFAGAFRRSELVALDVADLVFGSDGLTVSIRRSKTDQEGAGTSIGVPFGGNPDTCPVRAVRAWLDAVAFVDGAVFRAVDRHGHIRERLDGSEVARIVKRAVRRAGLDPARYSGHSLRAGLATSAAAHGKGDRSIMAQGRWKSRAMVDRYVRDASLFRDNAAAGIGL